LRIYKYHQAPSYQKNYFKCFIETAPATNK